MKLKEYLIADWGKFMTRHEKMQHEMKQMAEENKIEMEDDQGNVMSAKTYNDLRAQGII